MIPKTFSNELKILYNAYLSYIILHLTYLSSLKKEHVLCIFLFLFSIFSSNICIASYLDPDSLNSLYYMPIEEKEKPFIPDPFEDWNRKVFEFNMKMFKDISHYKKYLSIKKSRMIRSIVKNFFLNISDPLSAVNFALQQSPDKALTSAWRFIINSTIGLLGCFDAARHFGLARETVTFRDTFKYYKMKDGAYLVLPIIGPRTLLDIVATVLDNALNPVFFLMPDKIFTFFLLNAFDIYNMLGYIEYDSIMLDDSLDSYAKLRSIYIQTK